MERSFSELVNVILSSTSETDIEGAWSDLSGRSTHKDPSLGWQARLLARCLSALTLRRILTNVLNRPTEVGGPGSLPEDSHPSPRDRAILLRQVLRSLGEDAKLKIRSEYVPEIDPFFKQSSLKYRRLNEQAYIVEARRFDELEPECSWPLVDARQEQRKIFEEVSPDAVLMRWTRFANYRSLIQKEAIRRIFTAPERAVILVTLPTGSGKSICAQLPPLQWTRGGESLSEGVTIVLVPTIALAEDQYIVAKELFERNTESVARITGDTKKQERKILFNKIASGQLSLVFMSPEMALTDGREAIEEAARHQKLRMIVIDEVHLIETWGAKFRPAIQRFAEFRKRLRDLNTELTTVLLSATVSVAGKRRIQDLYCDPTDPFIHLDGSELRNEHDYVAIRLQDGDERDKKLVKLLNHLPRPLLLYTSLVAEAERIFNKLSQLKYQRIRCFTGNTNGADRKEIVEMWRQDRVDLVVATSAFGLGVDKPDVRAVVHATLPENLGRLYQEIGRGGRDGFPCLSVVMTIKQDIGVARRNALGSLISSYLASERWKAMLLTAHHEDVPGKVVRRLNLDTQPPHVARQTVESGRTNREWNEGTLLLLERAGLIEPWNFTDDPSSMPVQIHDVSCFQTGPELEAVLEPHRAEEQAENYSSLDKVSSWTLPNRERCSSREFCEMYKIPYPGDCGRCWYCRKKGSSVPRVENLAIVRDRSPVWGAVTRTVNDKLQSRLGPFKIGAFQYDDAGFNNQHLCRQLLEGCRRLGEDGVDQFIVPTLSSPLITDEIKPVQNTLGIMVTRDQIKNKEIDDLHILPTTVIFTPFDHMSQESDNLYKDLNEYNEKYSSKCPLIFIVPENFRLTSLPDKFFVSILDIKEVVKVATYVTELD